MELTNSGNLIVQGEIFPSSLQFYDAELKLTMKVYLTKSGSKLMEIFNGGKSLTVNRDGSISGDLPVDEAAMEFWKAIARVQR